MKRSSIILIVLVISSVRAWTQTANNSLLNVPQESVFLNYNESLLFSGEYLMYKLYCIDKSTRKASDISKIAYVSLVDNQGAAVFTHKVRLTSGSGYGDFFIPTSVPTGSYKLLGYSEWMKNFGSESFFQSDVLIVNPYQATPEANLEEPLDSLSMAEVNTTSSTFSVPAPQRVTSQLLNLKLDKAEVGKREKMTIQILTDDVSAKHGDYSLSVRKLESIPSPSRVSSLAFFNERVLKGDNKMVSGSTLLHLPELRGEVISGTITNKDSGTPVEGQRISLSLPGDKYLLKITSSDANGKFKFIAERQYDNTNAVLQILSDDWDQYEVSLDAHGAIPTNLEFVDFKLSKEMKAYILQKSIQNQIENAYREQRADSVMRAQHISPYYRDFETTYDLDDYTRFNSISETIVEVVDQVSIRRLNSGDQVFEIRPEVGYTDLSLLPMVFVDGLFLKRHEDLMDFSAKKIKSISFSRDKVMLGSQAFQGVLLFKTIEGGFYTDFYAPHIQNVELFKPQPLKDYFNQEYSSNSTQQRIPDFRHQLIWQPDLDVSNGETEIEFFTSDISGEYELVLEGFTSNGNPVSIKERFTVQ